MATAAAAAAAQAAGTAFDPGWSKSTDGTESSMSSSTAIENGSTVGGFERPANMVCLCNRVEQTHEMYHIIIEYVFVFLQFRILMFVTAEALSIP